MAADEISVINENDETRPLLSKVSPDPPHDESDSIYSGSTTFSSPSAARILSKICVLILGDFLANVDFTLLITIYERVASEFESSDNAAWLILSATLVNAVCLPVYGYLGDRYDSKKIILTAYVLLISGCLIVGVAASFWQVILGRIVTCAGGAGLYSMSAIVIADNASPADVGVLRSYVVAAAFVGRNTGPIIGGILTDALGWRNAFLCEVPAGLFCAAMTWWLFDSSNKPDNHKDVDSNSSNGIDLGALAESLDLIGILLFAAVATAFVFALTNFDVSGGLGVCIMSTAVFVVCSIALFWRERSVGDRAFIPASAFSRSLATPYLIQIFWITSYFSTMVLIPLYFASVENATSSQIALHILPIGAFSTLSNLVSSRMIKATKHYKYITHLGAACACAGFFLLAFLWQGNVGIAKSLLPALLGLAGGAINASTFMAVSLNSEGSHKGALVGFFFLSQEIGSILGIAGSSTLINTIFERNLLALAPSVPDRGKIIAGILRDSRFAFSLPESWQVAVATSFLKSWKIFCLVCGSVVVVLQPLILTVVEKAME